MIQQRWEFDLTLVYSSLAVYISGLKDPLNRWTSTHGRQGFSWRPGSVSFATIDADDPSNAIIVLLDTYTDPTNAIRIIKVPFEVGTEEGKQAIGTLQKGEKVLAYNPKTGKMELQPSCMSGSTTMMTCLI